MRFGMSSVRGAGATAPTPPAPGLIQNDQGQWGYYDILPGSEVTTFVPYVSPTMLTPNHPVMPTGDSTPGSTTGDSNMPMTTGGTSSTGDTTPGIPTQPMTSPLGRVLPTLRQVIPCAPNWTPRAYGGSNLRPPSLNQAPVTYLAGAGAANSGFHADLTFADVLSWASFGLGLLVGQQIIDNIYDQRRIA
jgi:hypothetical protein